MYLVDEFSLCFRYYQRKWRWWVNPRFCLFSLLVLIRNEVVGIELRIFLCKSRAGKLFLWPSWIGVVPISVCGVLEDDKNQWWLVFVPMGADATVGNGCSIQEHLHSFRKVKYLQSCSKTFWMEQKYPQNR